LHSKLFALNGPSASQVAGNVLRIPRLFTGDSIVASEHTQTVWSDMPTTVRTLGESYPAPTIRMKRGERFTATLRNTLQQPTNIHWHGLLVPADMDGHPMDVVTPGGTKTYDFMIDQRAGIYWYHPHPDTKTAGQVYKGMAGFFIVQDDEELALGLPSGAYEIPIVIQDRRMRADRAFDYTLAMADRMAGFLGDTILANGTPDAEAELAATVYRLRLLNGSNARVYKLAMSDQRQFHVSGTDCGLLDRPYTVSSLYLGPGERVDLLVDLSADTIGTSVRLVAETFDGAIDSTMQGWGGDILRMNVIAKGPEYSIPTSLVQYERLDPSKASRTRSFRLKMVVPMPPNGMHTINDRIFDGMRIDETVAANDVEIWELINDTPDEPHPMHLHGAQFQIIDRAGEAITDPKDMGWKDTVLVWPNETVRVAVKFGPHDGTFMMHCHNLEHEDDGMMMNFEVVRGSSDVRNDHVNMPERMGLR
jgi:FtsP/CotA-like multicopper oxidase with cupredoxin domain